jgi:hypothetical protein
MMMTVNSTFLSLFYFLASRSFYEKQDELILAFEDISKPDDENNDEEDDGSNKSRASLFAKITLGINFVSKL